MRSLLLCLLVGISMSVYAQNIEGTIIDSQNQEGLPYVTILNLNNGSGTVSDADGKFSIPAKANVDQLKVSFVGYEEQVVTAQNGNITLKKSSRTLSEVIVSGNREKEKRSETPIAISALDSKTIEDNKPTSIDQILNQVPGVNMVDLGNEQHSMSIRRPIDFGASYLYLEDGIPIRASGVFNHNALLEINMANVERIEVVRGPSSSIYGGEAIGGAVNFISHKPSATPTAGVSIQGNDIGYRRVDLNASTTFNEKVGVRVGGYYANQKDGVISHSDFDKLALSASLHYDISNNTELVWSNDYINYYGEMSGSLDSAAFFGENYESSQTFTNRQVDAFRTKLAVNHHWSDQSKTTFTGFYRNNSIKQNPSYRVRDDYRPWTGEGDPNLATGEINDNSFDSYGLLVQHKQKLQLLNSSIIVGGSVDYSPNTYESEAISIYKSDDGIYESFTQTGTMLSDYNADLFNWAVYSQLKLNPAERLFITLGGRYDEFNFDFENLIGEQDQSAAYDREDSKFNNFTPTVGMTYEINTRTGIYANYGQGFVPPQVNQLYRNSSSSSGNADLKPSSYHNYEVGGWMTVMPSLAKIDVSYYVMDGTNEIISVLQDDGSTLRQNAGETRHQGIEYGVSVTPIEDILLRVSGTNSIHKFTDYVEGGESYNGNQMPQAPKWVANGQVTYKPSQVEGLRVSLEWQHIGEYNMDREETKTYGGHDVFHFRAGYRIHGVEVWTNVMNISDELYATSARSSRWGDSYSVGKPRHITVGLSYNFK